MTYGGSDRWNWRPSWGGLISWVGNKRIIVAFLAHYVTGDEHNLIEEVFPRFRSGPTIHLQVGTWSARPRWRRVKEGSLAPNKEVVSEESEREPSSMVASRGADCGEGEAKTGSLSTTMEAGDGEPGSRVRRRPPSMVGLVGPSCWGDEEEGRNWSTTIEGEEGLGTRELVQPRTTGRCSASQSMVGALGIQLVS
jgi:hypothetical protein